MPFEALKFIHATGLFVDRQVRDVGVTSSAARQVIRDASFKSLDRLIDTAVEQPVDFVLLTGNTFSEDDHSLQARVALLQGLQRLDENGIQTFVIPGPEDPADAWHSIPRLPDNVTIFDPHKDEPTAVMRDGQVIATLQSCPVWSSETTVSQPADPQPMGQSRLGPLRIGIVPPRTDGTPPPDETTVEAWLESHRIDYLALSTPFPRLRVLRPEQMAFCPGNALPVTGDETGVRGAALVSADGRSSVNLSLFPTSPLRREAFHLVLDESTTWDQLISVMHAAIEKLNGISHTDMLLAGWHLEGTGEVLELLHGEAAQTELRDLFEVDSTPYPNLLIHHEFHVGDAENSVPAPHHDAESADESADSFDTPPTVAESLRQRLDSSESIAGDVMHRLRSHHATMSTEWLQHLELLSSRLNSHSVQASARRYADQWFARIPALAQPAGPAGTMTQTPHQSAATVSVEHLDSMADSMESINGDTESESASQAMAPGPPYSGFRGLSPGESQSATDGTEDSVDGHPAQDDDNFDAYGS